MDVDTDGEWIRLGSGRVLRSEQNRRATFPLPHHPMNVRQMLLPHEKESEYNTLLAEVANEFPPVDFVTSILVERLGQQIWALRRFARAEALIYKSGSAVHGGLGKCLRENLAFRERAEKNSVRTIKELQRLKKERAKRPLSKEAQVRLPAETLFEKFSESIEQPKQWWRGVAEVLRDHRDDCMDPKAYE